MSGSPYSAQAFEEQKAAADTNQFASFGPLDSNSIDSWLVGDADNTISVKLGKVELARAP